MNLPNKLTIARMVLTPVFLLVVTLPFIPHPINLYIGFAVYLAGCVTDFLDGKIARKYNLITVFGQLADPVADKMLTTAALLVFLEYGACDVYTVFIILTREFAVTAVRLAAAAQGVVIPANIWGKLKTATQMVFSVVILAGMVFGLQLVLLAAPVMMWITAVLAVISGIIYIAKGVKLIDFNR